MKSFVLALCLAGVVVAGKAPFNPRVARAPQLSQYQYAPQQFADPLKPKQIAIISQNSNAQYDGNFAYDFQAENGIQEETVGSVKVIDPEHQAQVMQGRYAYVAPDGTPIEATWYADETGFHVQGAHLPTPPPIPEAIARSLEYIRSLPPAKEDQYQPLSSTKSSPLTGCRTTHQIHRVTQFNSHSQQRHYRLGHQCIQLIVSQVHGF